MPLAQRRNLTVTRVCARPNCGTLYNPWRGREDQPGYCSRDCGRASGVFKKTGRWPGASAGAARGPAHAGPVRGSASVPAGVAVLPPVTAEQLAEEWDAAAERWEAVAARAERQNGGTLVLAGCGVRLSVERSALVVARGRSSFVRDGSPITRYERALHNLSRIVVVGSAGAVSLAAVQWCSEQGIALSVLSQDGELLASPGGTGDAKLRRAQYTASPDTVAAICRELILRKLAAQRAALESIRTCVGEAAYGRAIAAFDMAKEWLALPGGWREDVGVLRTYEARCARAYFAALESLPVHFTGKGMGADVNLTQGDEEN
jgi:hypothetical protein